MEPRKIGCLLIVLLGGLTSGVQAATAPNDMVSVFSFTNSSKCDACFDEKYYQKKFKDIRLDQKTMAFIRSKTAEMDSDGCPNKHPLCVHRLISLRIYNGSVVQRLVIGNKLGEYFAWDDSGSTCSSNLTGNGFLGSCSGNMPGAQ